MHGNTKDLMAALRRIREDEPFPWPEDMAEAGVPTGDLAPIHRAKRRRNEVIEPVVDPSMPGPSVPGWLVRDSVPVIEAFSRIEMNSQSRRTVITDADQAWHLRGVNDAWWKGYATGFVIAGALTTIIYWLLR